MEIITKRFIQSTTNVHDSILLEDTIVIRVEFDPPILSSISVDAVERFPGRDKFRTDVLDILENEFGFEVEDDTYNGKIQKGWVSNDPTSDSIYFNVFYDLRKNNKFPEKLKPILDKYNVPGLVYCFILFRFSDYPNYSQFTDEHDEFVRDNRAKHIGDRSDVVYHDDPSIEVPENELQYDYQDALDDLRDRIKGHIDGWVTTAASRVERIYNKKRKSGR